MRRITFVISGRMRTNWRLIVLLRKIRIALERITEFEKVIAERNQLKSECDSMRQQIAEKDRLQSAYDSMKRTLDELYVPPGHFFSPLPDHDDVRKNETRIFGSIPAEIPGVDLKEEEQFQLLNTLSRYYPDLPYSDTKQPGLRYYYVNDAYTYGDGIILYCMIRHLAPKRIIEVGSGFSSCMLLDVNEIYFDGAIDITFIEPYPELLLTLIDTGDRRSARLIDKRLQDIEIEQFEVLQDGDVLFIDSTHVSKIDSDVNYLFFEILPRLSPGVHIHFHDIFYPFEYPKWWVYEGRGWSESYLLRAFLQYNKNFSISLMNTYMRHTHLDFFENHMPLCLKRLGGSIWIRKSA